MDNESENETHFAIVEVEEGNTDGEDEDEESLNNRYIQILLHGEVETLRKFIEKYRGKFNLHCTHNYDKQDALQISIKKNKVEMVKYLLTELEFVSKKENLFGYNALHVAVLAGNLAITKLILEFGKVDIFSKTRCGLNSLHIAAQHGFLEIMKYIISIAGKEIIHSKNRYNQTILHFAVEYEYLDIIKYIVQLSDEYEFDLNSKDITGVSALYLALSVGNITIIKYLIEDAKLDLYSVTNYGKSILYPTVTNGKFKTLKYLLLDCKFDINKTLIHPKNHSTPPIHELQTLHPHNQTNDVDNDDDNDDTAVHDDSTLDTFTNIIDGTNVKCHYNDVDETQKLINHKNITSNNNNISNNDPDDVNESLSINFEENHEPQKSDALYAAIVRGRFKMVKLLIALGFNIYDIYLEKKRSILHKLVKQTIYLRKSVGLKIIKYIILISLETQPPDDLVISSLPIEYKDDPVYLWKDNFIRYAITHKTHLFDIKNEFGHSIFDENIPDNFSDTRLFLESFNKQLLSNFDLL